MKRFNLSAIIFIAVYIGFFSIRRGSGAEPFSGKKKERSFLLEEKIKLNNLPHNIANLRIWIPYPDSDRWQVISDFKLAGQFENSFVIDEKYGNRIIYLKPKKNILDEGTSEIILSFKVKRKEYNAPFAPSAAYGTFSKFLKANRLVPVNGKVKALAEKITRRQSQDLEKVRALYDYIINELTYSKDDPKVCGIGDSLLTLEVKKGICTDYHSLFISLVRSLGIPAKFKIGFPIPAEESRGVIEGYHCWAEFYLKGKGWIPVDVSEADKHPERRDYFFGHIDENRVRLTTGRDIKLKYAKNQEPLNFFIYPYAELNNSEFYGLDFEISFRNIVR